MRRVLIGPALAMGVSMGMLAASACGSSDLPAPAFVQQPTSALSQIPYVPPPPRIEYVPEKPKTGGVVWIDGEWVWQGQRWAWKRGRWVKPPTNAAFAPWTTVRDKAGTLYMAQGAWRDRFGVEVPEPEPVALAGRVAVPVVGPAGDEIPTTVLRENATTNFDASISAAGQRPLEQLIDASMDAFADAAIGETSVPDALPLPPLSPILGDAGP